MALNVPLAQHSSFGHLQNIVISSPLATPMVGSFINLPLAVVPGSTLLIHMHTVQTILVGRKNGENGLQLKYG